jgi:hypothetical protein
MDQIMDDSRFQSWYDLKNLQPNTTYYVAVGFKSFLNEDIYSKTLYKVRTSCLDDNFNFIAGGDVEWSDAGIQLSILAAKNEPMFAYVGEKILIILNFKVGTLLMQMDSLLVIGDGINGSITGTSI